MSPEEMKRRTAALGLGIIRFAEDLPRDRAAEILARQLIRCGTSVGANHRAACRARSTAEFVAKLGIVEEEADEVGYWLQLLCDAGIVPNEHAQPLIDEASQIVSIVVASIRTARHNSRSPR